MIRKQTDSFALLNPINFVFCDWKKVVDLSRPNIIEGIDGTEKVDICDICFCGTGMDFTACPVAFACQ